jgi:hypothetical protein
MPAEQLSDREREALEHLQKAQELSVSLAEYARSFDLDVKELYSAKQSLVRKGAYAGGRASDDEGETAKISDFVPVQLMASRAPTAHPSVCRIHHPSGLVIECASFPPASWLSVLLTRANDVPA